MTMSKTRNPDALIRIGDAIKFLCRKYCYPGLLCPDSYCVEMWDELEDVERIDAVPVRHGRWIKKRYWSEGVGMGERYGYYYSCSKCGNLVCGGYDECGKKYCDECGARMDGKDGDGND